MRNKPYSANKLLQLAEVILLHSGDGSVRKSNRGAIGDRGDAGIHVGECSKGYCLNDAIRNAEAKELVSG